jgi:hypothetical protein
MSVRTTMQLAIAVSIGVLVLSGLGAASSAQGQVRPSLYEPPDGFAYSGMYLRTWDSSDLRIGDTRPFAERLQDAADQELAGKPPAIVLVPTTWQREDGVPIPFENTLEEIRKFHDFGYGQRVAFIKWNAQSGWDNSTSAYRGITTRDIVQGKLDGYIHQYARDVRAYGRPLFISPICAEFNGGYWNCGPAVNRSITVADFITAWRRVVDIFRSEGATNVAWVWNPMPPPNGGLPFEPFWPGDEYVDWAGIDMYDGEAPANIEASYQFAVAHGKPFFLGEWGTRVGGNLTPQQQRDWLNGMFEMFESHPKIKAIVYYNYKQLWSHEDPAHMGPHTSLYGGQVNYHPNVNDGDSRLLADSGAGFRELYSRRIAHPRYLSAIAVQ